MRNFMAITCSVLLSLVGTRAFAQQDVVGRVYLDPEYTIPGDFVMIYFPELGTGTMADESGCFDMKLPAHHSNKMQVEYSRIGYETVVKTVTLNGDVTELDTVVMEAQTLMLQAAYVAPEGMTAEEYILSRFWAKAKENRETRLTYGADITYDFATHELPLVAGALPKGKVRLVKIASRFMGYGSLVNFVLKNDDISASVSMNRTSVKGKSMDFNEKITASNPDPLPKGVQNDIFQVFHEIDLFDLVYGETTDWGEKFSKKHRFRLVGTYQYHDKFVDVLSWTGREKITVNLHIVEEEWGILKIQCESQEGEVLRAECRDTGKGVYMPISFVLKPTITKFRNEDIHLLIEEADKSSQLTDKSKERVRKILEERIASGEDFNPYISCGFNVRYR